MSTSNITRSVGKGRHVLAQQSQLLQLQIGVARATILITGQSLKVMRLVPGVGIGSIGIQVVLVGLVVIFTIEILEVTGNDGLLLALFVGVVQVVVTHRVETFAVFVAVIDRQDEVFENIDVEAVAQDNILLVVLMVRTVVDQIGPGTVEGGVGMSFGIDRQPLGSLGRPRSHQGFVDLHQGRVDGSQTAVLVRRVKEIHVVRIAQPGFDFHIEFGAGRIGVVGIGGYVQDTLLAVVPAAHIIFHPVVSSPYREVVFLLRTGFAEEIMIPVEIGIVPIRTVVLQHYPGTVGMLGLVVAALIQHLHLLGRIVGKVGSILRVVGLVDQAHLIVTRGHIVGRCRILRPTEPAVEAYRSFAGLVGTRLCRNKYNTFRRGSTIDGGSRSIFQNRNRLDVVGVDHIQLGHHTVDHNQRGIGRRDRRYTADIHIVTTAGTPRLHRQVQRRIGTLQGHGHVTYGAGVNLLGRNGSHGSRQVHLLLGTVAHHNHLVEQLVGIFHLDKDKVLAVDRNSLFFIADRSDLEGRIGGYVFHSKSSVHIGRTPDRGSGNLDYGPDNGLVILVDHLTGQRITTSRLSKHL